MWSLKWTNTCWKERTSVSILFPHNDSFIFREHLYSVERMNEVAPYHVGIQFLLYFYVSTLLRILKLPAAFKFIRRTPFAKNDGLRYFTTFRSIELFHYLHSSHDLVWNSSSFWCYLLNFVLWIKYMVLSIHSFLCLKL